MKFCPYVMVWYPNRDECLEIIATLVKYGAEMIELWLPFSDPAADGPLLTEVNTLMTAQQHDMDYYLSIVQEIRTIYPSLELMVMTYLNPVYRYGFDVFCHKLDDMWVDHLLVVDLPLSEFKPYYPSDLSHLQFVFIVSQNCDEQYLHNVTQQSYGSILYIMTTLATTWSGKGYDFTIVHKLKQLKSKNLIAWFGIKTKEDIAQVSESWCDGYIIGSELVRQYQQGWVWGLGQYLTWLK